MKILACSLFLCLCTLVFAQDAKISSSKDSSEETINFFTMNAAHFPKSEISKIDLKMPSLFEQGQYKIYGNWHLPAQNFHMFCPSGGNQTNSLIGTQSVFNFKWSKTRITTTYTFDEMGNLMNSEITFGGN